MDLANLLRSAQHEAAERLAEPGDWLTGLQRIAAWNEVRDAAANPLDEARQRAVSPFAVAGKHEATDHLGSTAVEVVHRVATDPGRLTRAWAERAIAELGEETYTELVGVTAIATIIDRFDLITSNSLRPLPMPVGGRPARIRPDDVGDVGAWVSQAVDKTRANVSRALTLVPRTQSAWRPLVDSHYSRGPEFLTLVWDRAMSRPQVELIAARTTALNECFY
ncbi:MAG: hypothetical protein OEV40_24615 [Acidimicrobiia bacterium]|nr:hypothetical protein [Acidimicrobiia bacterium]